MDNVILHLDFDSFFASVEQQYSPVFRGKPFVVTAQNGRTCIIASSREAKKLGIKTGCRLWEAKRICPDLLIASADFIKYWEVSKKFINICKDYSPFVEVFSIDEVFIDVTKTYHLFGGLNPMIFKIKQRIRKEIGEYITVSVGISHNKLLAKLASSIKKPDGIYKIGFRDIDFVYAKACLTDICGIGERIAFRLNEIRIFTLLDLRKTSFDLLVARFGESEARFLRNVSLGIDNSSVVPYTVVQNAKSIGRHYCLPKNEYDKREVFKNIYELCEEIGIKLRRLKKKAKTVGLSLYGDTKINARKTHKTYFNEGKDIFDLATSLIDINNLNYVRQIAVWVSGLEEESNISLSLFDCDLKRDKLIKAVDAINERFGDHTIRNAFLLYADKLTTVPNGYLADSFERLKLAG